MVLPYHKCLSKSLKNDLWQTWCAGILQRRQYHQEPPDGPKGSRSNPQEEWGHL